MSASTTSTVLERFARIAPHGQDFELSPAAQHVARSSAGFTRRGGCTGGHPGARWVFRGSVIGDGGPLNDDDAQVLNGAAGDRTARVLRSRRSDPHVWVQVRWGQRRGGGWWPRPWRSVSCCWPWP